MLPSILLVSVLAVAVTALPQGSDCTPNCCANVVPASNPTTSNVLGLLGIVVQGVDVLVGLDCQGLPPCAAGTQPTCCTGNSVGGLVTIGCSPISLKLV